MNYIYIYIHAYFKIVMCICICMRIHIFPHTYPVGSQPLCLQESQLWSTYVDRSPEDLVDDNVVKAYNGPPETCLY